MATDNIARAIATDAKKYTDTSISDVTLQLVNISNRKSIGNHISEGVAHRGNTTTAPENTLPAYTLAKTNGFKYVECDVSWTADNIPVLLHDNTIDRTSDGTGGIESLTLDQVELYDFGSWKHSDYIGTKIPTFKEFIILCKSLQLHPYIELKGTITSEQAVIVADIVKKLGMITNVTWISFSSASLTEILKVIPFARIGYICSISTDNINVALNLKTEVNEVFIDSDYNYVTQELLDYANSQFIPVEVWTIDDSVIAYKLAKMGINGATTNSLIMNNVMSMKETTLAYWKMNETDGTTISDLSGNNNTGTINGAITVTDGIVTDGGKSRTGDGINGYISTLFNGINLTNIKISAYIRRNSDMESLYQGIISNYRNSSEVSRGFHVSYYHGTPSCLIAKIITSTGNTLSISSNHDLLVGITYKFILEYDGNMMKLITYSVSGGTLTKLYEGIYALTGSLNNDMLPLNMLANNTTTPLEYAPFTIDEVKITTIK